MYVIIFSLLFGNLMLPLLPTSTDSLLYLCFIMVLLQWKSASDTLFLTENAFILLSFLIDSGYKILMLALIFTQHFKEIKDNCPQSSWSSFVGKHFLWLILMYLLPSSLYSFRATVLPASEDSCLTLILEMSQPLSLQILPPLPLFSPGNPFRFKLCPIQ